MTQAPPTLTPTGPPPSAAPGRLPLAILAGVGGAVAGALIWAASIHYSPGIWLFGLSVLATGAAVGYPIRWVGRSSGLLVGAIGAVLAVVAALAGEAISILWLYHISLGDLFGDQYLQPFLNTTVCNWVKDLTYVIAAYIGFVTARR